MPKEKPKKASMTPIRNVDGSITITVRLVSMNPDGVQYKPYSTHFEIVGDVYVRVTVPAHMVVQDDPLILSEQGAWIIAKKLSAGSLAVSMMK
jgi:hypothetical protein